MKYQLYPGCSLRGTGKAFEESLAAVCRTLGVELQELDDWNCCGATTYMSIDENAALALSVRNLAIAERSPLDLMAPCPACCMTLNKAQHTIEEFPDRRTKVDAALQSTGLTYQGKTKVRHPLDILVNDVGLEAIKAKVTRPLTGLKVIPYYGCLVVRPYATFDDPVRPMSMDNLLAAAGATVLDYPLKTRCCGGSLTGVLPDVGPRLVYIHLREAIRRGADAIAVDCSLCQFNLEGYQDQVAKQFGKSSIPIVYFSQLLGLSMGLGEQELGLQRSIVELKIPAAR